MNLEVFVHKADTLLEVYKLGAYHIVLSLF